MTIKSYALVLAASFCVLASVPVLANEIGDVTVVDVVPGDPTLPDPSDVIAMDPTIDTLPGRAGDDGIIQPNERNLPGEDGAEIALGNDDLSPEIYQTMGGAEFGDQAADRAADQAAERVEAAIASKAPAEPAA